MVNVFQSVQYQSTAGGMKHVWMCSPLPEETKMEIQHFLTKKKKKKSHTEILNDREQLSLLL